jgi:hypothetical protein
MKIITRTGPGIKNKQEMFQMHRRERLCPSVSKEAIDGLFP